MGGNNLPIVTENIPNKDMCVRGGYNRLVLNDQGGSVMDVSINVTGTLRAEMGGHQPIVMESIPEILSFDTTQDQGGIAVVYPLEGNGVRESHRGPGYSETDKMFTLNTVEQHAVAYCIAGPMVDRETTMHGTGISEEVSSTLTAADRHAVYCMGHDERSAQFSPDVTDPLTGSDYKQPPVVAQVSTRGGQSAYAVGNGQLHQANLQDKTGALNCMHAQIAIMQEVAQGSKSSEACAPMTDEDSTDRT